MKCDEALAGKEKDAWKKAVTEEHKRMLKHKVFETVPQDQVPYGAKVLTSTWVMKKKANGMHRARLNACSYEQIDREHYDKDFKFALVVSDATIHIILILIVMAGWWAELLDVKGAFLHGVFEKGQKVYMEVPQGFEKYYPKNRVLLLLKTLYGTKQATKAFWLKLLEALHGMGYERIKADPCLYFDYTVGGLVIWLSWVDA
jgi:Reverse transcriptase (RNA-dependent DNA polymerase)